MTSHRPQAGLLIAQGVELPTETSPASRTHDQCGQAATLTFYMQLLPTVPLSPEMAPPGSTANGANFSSVGCCCPPDGEAADGGTTTNGRTVDRTAFGGSEAGARGSDAARASCDYRGIWSYRRAWSNTGCAFFLWFRRPQKVGFGPTVERGRTRSAPFSFGSVDHRSWCRLRRSHYVLLPWQAPRHRCSQ